MLDNETKGIWCQKDNTWYYLECGDHVVGIDPIKRLKSALIQRGKITFAIDGHKPTEHRHKMMTYKEAVERGYKIEPIFLNKFIKEQYEAKAATKSKPNVW